MKWLENWTKYCSLFSVLLYLSCHGHDLAQHYIQVNFTLYVSQVFENLTNRKGATVPHSFTSWKTKPKFFNFYICYQCQSSPSLTILVPFWFITGIISLVFFSLSKWLQYFQVSFNILKEILYTGSKIQNVVTELLYVVEPKCQNTK